MMKSATAILICLILAACAHSSVSTSQASGICQSAGYGYDGYDSASFKDCVDYMIEAGKSSGTAPLTPAQYFCKKDGIKADAENYGACMKEKGRLVAEMDKKAAEHVKVMAKEKAAEAKRIEKARQAALARQKALDTEQCKGYGFHAGTDKMATCIMQIQQARIAEENNRIARQELMQQQAAIAEAQRQQAANAATLNYLGQMEQAQAVNNLVAQQRMQSMQPVRLQTTCSGIGNSISCY